MQVSEDISLHAHHQHGMPSLVDHRHRGLVRARATLPAFLWAVCMAPPANQQADKCVPPCGICRVHFTTVLKDNALDTYEILGQSLDSGIAAKVGNLTEAWICVLWFRPKHAICVPVCPSMLMMATIGLPGCRSSH